MSLMFYNEVMLRMKLSNGRTKLLRGLVIKSECGSIYYYRFRDSASLFLFLAFLCVPSLSPMRLGVECTRRKLRTKSTTKLLIQ